MEKRLVPQAIHPEMPNLSVIQHVAAMLAPGLRQVLMMIVAIFVKCSPFRAFDRNDDAYHE